MHKNFFDAVLVVKVPLIKPIRSGMRIKHSIIIWILAIAALGSGWLLILSDKFNLPKNDLRTPDAIMTGIDAVKFDQNGAPKHFFKASRLTHYAADNSILMQKPIYLFKDQKNTDWHITSDSGKMFEKTDIIYLTGHVKIQQFTPKRKKPTTILTSKMTLYLKQSRGITHQPVTILQPGTTVHAVGMRVDLKKGRIRLLSKVHGEYQTE